MLEIYLYFKFNLPREIYYLHTDMFKDQKVVSSSIRDICSLLGASPWDLAINCSSKGLMCGSIVIKMSDGSEQDYRSPSNGCLLPYNLKSVANIWTNAQFVLIVEKDTTFQRLLNDRIFNKLAVPFILLTVCHQTKNMKRNVNSIFFLGERIS